jgi:catechol 2,3-dioxygenase-like lactoylglutathione lyase family enzyme
MTLLAPFRAAGTAAVHQVGVVVSDLERAIAGHSRLLGLDEQAWRRASFDLESVSELNLRGEPAAFSMRLAFAGSDPEIELIEPVAGASIYREWLEERGEGVHHLAVAVASLAKATAAMEASGFGVLQDGRGFQPDGTGGFAYYDTAQVLGYVLEAVELP